MDIDTITQRARETAIIQYVRKSILPIIGYFDNNETGERRAGIHGTGTLFKFLDKYFLVTAAHVLEPIDELYEKNIGIPVSKKKPDVITLHDCERYLSNDETMRNKYDFGIIKLSDKLGKELEQNYHFLNEKNVSFKNYNRMKIIISGYPECWTSFDNKESILYSKPFNFMSRRIIPTKTYDNYDPNAHILAEYTENYYIEGDVGRYVPAEQELGGISGSSMWTIEDNQLGIWSPEKNLKVIGIQSAIMKNEYIKGTKWIYMAEAFKCIDDDIYLLLSECIKSL